METLTREELYNLTFPFHPVATGRARRRASV